MRTRTRVTGVLLAAGALVGGVMGVNPAGSAESATAAAAVRHVVRPGPHAIQNAIDAAAPGDVVVVRPGIYRESVIITKSLTLRGSGATAGGTLLRPPANPGRRGCVDPDNPDSVQGICIFGRFDNQGNVIRTVRDVTVSGFWVRGFSGTGILALASADITVEHNRAQGNDEYGIAGFVGKRSVFSHNEALGNTEPGLYMGDSPAAGGRIVGNVTKRNEYGIFLRDSTGMLAANNDIRRNCIGVFPLDTGGGPAAGNYQIRNNDILRNNKACPASDETGAPPFSGLGVLLGGVHDVDLVGNRILGNSPSAATVASGGVVLFSTLNFGGADPRDNTVRDNIAFRNDDFDLDAGGFASTNTFVRNVCGTGRPARLC